MYQKPPEPCREPFTPCWCESRPNNPHCADALPIDNMLFTIIIASIIILYVAYIFNNRNKKLTEIEIEKEIQCKLFWIRFEDRYLFNANAYFKKYFKKDGTLKKTYKEIFTKQISKTD